MADDDLARVLTLLHESGWAEPLPPAGPVGLVVDWPSRNLPETRVELDGDAIRDAAARAVTLWP